MNYPTISGISADPWAYDRALCEVGSAHDLSASAELAREAILTEAAKETLMAIDEMAVKMMAGAWFRPPAENGKWPSRISLARSGYYEEPEYASIEVALASGDADAVALAVKQLRALMLQACREDAAWFLLELTSAGLRDMELLVSEHFGGGK